MISHSIIAANPPKPPRRRIYRNNPTVNLRRHVWLTENSDALVTCVKLAKAEAWLSYMISANIAARRENAKRVKEILGMAGDEAATFIEAGGFSNTDLDNQRAKIADLKAKRAEYRGL